MPGISEVQFVSSNTDRVVIKVELSDVGSIPLTHLEVNFTGPDDISGGVLNFTLTDLLPGDSFEVTVPGLQDDTVYSISVSIYNYGGRGPSSQDIQVATGRSCIIPC